MVFTYRPGRKDRGGCHLCHRKCHFSIPHLHSSSPSEHWAVEVESGDRQSKKRRTILLSTVKAFRSASGMKMGKDGGRQRSDITEN